MSTSKFITNLDLLRAFIVFFIYRVSSYLGLEVLYIIVDIGLTLLYIEFITYNILARPINISKDVANILT